MDINEFVKKIQKIQEASGLRLESLEVDADGDFAGFFANLYQPRADEAGMLSPSVDYLKLLDGDEEVDKSGFEESREKLSVFLKEVASVEKTSPFEILGADILDEQNAFLGFFERTKSWDLVVVSGQNVLRVES